MHVALKQHPPDPHRLPAQQGSPVCPHTWQSPADVEVDEQTVPDAQRSVPLVPAQHCSPASPHDEHRPLRQARFALQVLPQQGWPAAPQPPHFPALHMPGPVPPPPPVPSAEPPQADPSPTHISL
jgi:hypothetical protein